MVENKGFHASLLKIAITLGLVEVRLLLLPAVTHKLEGAKYYRWKKEDRMAKEMMTADLEPGLLDSKPSLPRCLPLLFQKKKLIIED